MASESHRHGDKWIKHNLTVIDKDGAHQTEGGNPGLAVPARAIRGGLAGLLGLASSASASASNSTARRSNSLRSFGLGALTAQLRR
jgi:hypothetical protein